MKIKLLIYKVFLAGLLLPLLLNCKKEAIKTAPTVTVSAATNITATTASSGGEVTANGGATVTASGVCWSINQNPTTADNKTSSGSGTGSFTSSLTGLTPGATYNIRAYAINSVGTGYSSQTTFTTLALAPVLTTADLSAITATTATSGGNITNDGGSPVTARGVCWSKSQNPTTADPMTTDGTGTGSFTSAITGLTPGTTYYVRAYATNSIGTAYGNQVTTITTATLSTLTTTVVSAITSSSATSGGNITSDGGAPITARGVCWSTSANPTITNSKTTDGTGTGSFVSSISGLTTNTTYYIRAYATNSAGTGYGSVMSFTTSNIGILFNPNLSYGTVTDIEGNVYKTITIGTQVWMAENLKTTKFNDGTSIPNITDNIAWGNLQQVGYCWYNNDSATYKNTYGALYKLSVVVEGKLAPKGWHVPTDDEWTTLTNYLGGESVAGGQLKEIGTTHWKSPNTGATNSSGFSALPGGYRGRDGLSGLYLFFNLGYEDSWWSSTGDVSGNFWMRSLYSNYSLVDRQAAAILYGFSVRCLKD